MAVQFLPVAVDEKQGVVARRTEYEHDQDGRGQVADGGPGLRQPIGGRLGNLDGSNGAQEREGPEHGAPVDREQDDPDDDEGAQQQSAQGGAATVRRDSSSSGHRNLEVATGTGRGPAHHFSDRFSDRLDGGGIDRGHVVRR
ncbi:MAG: hypothetical protein M0005_04420 [Actinomycetota bacterium]|nr:hypothetical protein [Actinomycetota bacterium]